MNARLPDHALRPDPIGQEDRFGAHNYHPLPVVLVRGEGVPLWDDQGRRYLDMMSAYSAVSFGHSHPRLVRALTEQAGRLARTDVTAQFRLTDPDALITVQLRDRPGDPVACGPTGIEPDVVLAMPAVVLHRLLLGTVNATVAMARGQIRTEGPVAKVLALIPTLRLVGPAYRERLEAAGRTDLLESG